VRNDSTKSITTQQFLSFENSFRFLKNGIVYFTKQSILSPDLLGCMKFNLIGFE